VRNSSQCAFLCYSSVSVWGKALRLRGKWASENKGESNKMLAIAKVLILAFAVTGVAGAGVASGVVQMPLQHAIDIHKNHLDQNSTMPEQCRHGQQNALDHLMENQQRWLSNPHNETADVNDTDVEQPETD
jgi:hypothetical protein